MANEIRFSKEVEKKLKDIVEKKAESKGEKEDSEKSKKLSKEDIEDIFKKLKESKEFSRDDSVNRGDVLNLWKKTVEGEKNKDISGGEALEEVVSTVPRRRKEEKDEEFSYMNIGRQGYENYSVDRGEQVEAKMWTEGAFRGKPLENEKIPVVMNPAERKDPGENYMNNKYDVENRTEFERISEPERQLTPEKEKNARKYEIR